jgi:hypothetical protein
MVYGLTQAAQATGLTRQGVLAAIKRGTISGSKNAQGQWEIDAAELHRIYPLITINNTNTPVNSDKATINALSTQEVNDLQQRLAVTEAMLREARILVDELKADREAWKRQSHEWMMMAKALPEGGSKPRRGFFARIFSSSSEHD